MKSLRLAGITLLAFLTIGFVSCNKDNNGNNTNEEIIEYQGEYPAPENIEYVEDGVTYEIEAIPGQVVISTEVDYNTVVNAVNSNGGSIIEQYPPFGHYLVEVTLGRELTFISAMNELNISADLNIVEYAKEKFDYYVFDDYKDVNGVQHGKKISNTLTSCQNTSVINEINVFYRVFLPLNISSYKFGWTLSKDNEQKQIFVNWSHGYGKNSDDWSIMSETERKNFIRGWEKSIKHTLDRIVLLKTKRPNIDIVFAQAAGNERCPLTSIINSLKLEPKYKTVLEENVIIVSDYSYYANTSSTYGDFCYIKEHPYYNPNGGTTSYATPQALCYINQVMKETVGEDGKNITAVQALAAVKAAIRQNSKGELDLDEALAMARYMYSPEIGYFVGTSFDKVRFNMGIGSNTLSETKTERVGEGYNYFTGTYSSFHNETQSNTTTNSLDMGVFNWFNYMYGTDLNCYDGFFTFTIDSIDFGRTKYKKGFDHNYIDFDPYPHNYVDRNRIIFPSGLPNPDNFDDLNGTFNITWYFEQNNVFCIKERFVFNWSFDSNVMTHSWGTHHKEIERLNKFTIDKNSNNCSFEMIETQEFTTPSYSSQYPGTLSYTKTEHWTTEGTWEKIE